MYIKGVTQDMVVNEINYYFSRKVINEWLNRGEITKNEFDELDKMNRNSFNSYLKDLM